MQYCAENDKDQRPFPLDTGRELNLHETSRRSLHSIYVLCPGSYQLKKISKTMLQKDCLKAVTNLIDTRRSNNA